MINLDEDSYFEYKQLVLKNMHKLKPGEKFNFLGTMISICIMGRRKGVAVFINETLEVCRIMLAEKSNTYSPGSNTDISRYLNMLANFIRFKDWECFDILVNDFGSKLDAAYKESIISYSYMLKLFTEGKFEKAFNYNNKIDYNHTLLRVNARILLIQLYYELGYIEELIHLLDSSHKFFSVIKHYSEAAVVMSLNFIKYLKMLIRNKDARDAEKLYALKKQIAGEDNINVKEWLVEKINEACELVDEKT